MKLIDGRAVARRIRTAVKQEVDRLDKRPGLGVILVGDDPASRLYVSLKEKACAEAGILFERIVFPADAEQEDVMQAVEKLNRRTYIDAMLVQLPLPPHLDTETIMHAIDPSKDVDGFHPKNLRAYLEGGGDAPGLIEAVSFLLDAASAPDHGLACALANSAVFSVPLEAMLSRRGLEPTEDTLAADVIVTATGKPGSLTSSMIKPGAIVIDVGTARVNGKTVGDADAQSIGRIAGALTPVPGGVGPVTVAMLLKKTLDLAKRAR